MEHIIYHAIIEHLNSHNIIIENQHGFRSQHSCVTQLIALIEDLSFAMDHHVILLDFSKAFDSVPHQRLLKKLQHYGINNNIYNWIETWLTKRSQCVVLNGVSSDSVPVQSGVPQGTVLGPLMFLLYINDISKGIHSPLRLFADDCLLYKVVTTEQDALQLQKDLDLLFKWAEKWQLKFNINKCTLMRFTRSTSPLTFSYQLNDHVLSTVDQHLYLGVLLHRKLSWSQHISYITRKATRTLNFLKRNLSNCSPEVKAAAYVSMVRTSMEYAAAVWDPHQVGDIQELEKVQRRAARWVMNDYGRYNSVTTMIQHLDWDTLKKRRMIIRLQTLFKIMYNEYALKIPTHYLPMTRHTRQYHPLHFTLPNSSTVTYQQSFYCKTINEWNHLPISTIEQDNLNLFTNQLQILL